MGVKERDDAFEALERSEAALRNAAERVRAALADTEEADLTVRELANGSGIGEEALLEFARTAGELLGDRALSVDAARRAGILAAAAQAWENELGPLLTSAQVRELLGDVSRQRVDELLRMHRLIGLRDESGRRRFPAFQFHDGRPQPPVIDAFWTIAGGAVNDWTAASWCVSPDPALDGLSPVRWIRAGKDPDRLSVVARRDAERLAQ